MTHSEQYLKETAEIAALLDFFAIEVMAEQLAGLRERRGRLFIAGLGGSAANASHAANDFRKLALMQAYCLSDNVAELTATANDDGWEDIYSEALSRFIADDSDALFVLSVGGGTPEVSLPLVRAIEYAERSAMRIFGVVGRDGGYTKENADCCIVVPTVADSRVTPHTESFQSVILHCLVSHPKLQRSKSKW